MRIPISIKDLSNDKSNTHLSFHATVPLTVNAIAQESQKKLHQIVGENQSNISSLLRFNPFLGDTIADTASLSHSQNT